LLGTINYEILFTNSSRVPRLHRLKHPGCGD
jgi:hypothetical protein